MDSKPPNIDHLIEQLKEHLQPIKGPELPLLLEPVLDIRPDDTWPVAPSKDSLGSAFDECPSRPPSAQGFQSPQLPSSASSAAPLAKKRKLQ